MKIILQNQVDKKDIKYLRDRLREFNEKHTEAENHQDLMILMKDEAGEIKGGITGDTYWGWFHVDTLWIADEFRNQGYGRQLLEVAEEEARKRGCKNAHLETHDFQALDFYRKNGYEVCGQLDDLPKGYNRYLLKKRI